MQDNNLHSDPLQASRVKARMPVLFIGHGSPMNAIADNAWSRAWRALGEELPLPRAILVISAHWYTRGTFLTGNAMPPTIHDFYGFPDELSKIQYPAPGDVALASEIARRLAGQGASLQTDWGLDHGTWSVLRHMRPAADCPVVQLSIDERRSPSEHRDIGRALAPLRDEGILILCSGSLTHNLRHALGGGKGTPPWARSFDDDVARALEQEDEALVVNALARDDGRMSHPTPEHYWPLLYAVGARAPGDAVSFPTMGFDHGSLSMRAVRFG